MAVTSCAKALRGSRGFTLLELLVVIALIALSTAGVALAMRDSGETTLEREALRLSALFDAARSQSQASGVAVTWEVATNQNNASSMLWRGLRSKEPLPTTWLDARIEARIEGGSRLVLGPDPVIAPQRVQLTLGGDSRTIASDGVGAFQVAKP